MAIKNGTSGNDSLVGTTGADTLNGLAGNDTLDGGAGADLMVGSLGDDRYIVDSIGDSIIELFNEGIDTIETSVLDSLSTYSLTRWAYVENLVYTGTAAAVLKGNSLDNVIRANSATSTADTLYGGAGNDQLFGFGGNDSLQGGAGNDTLNGGGGADMMVGGAGNDFYVIDSTGDRAFEYTNGGFDTISSAVFKDLRAGWTNAVEGLTYTGTAATALYGNRLSNAITSTSAANETIYGYEGDDTLDGGAGGDSLIGGTGNDVYFVAGPDVVSERAGEGIDSFVGLKTDISVATNNYATTIENLFYAGTANANLKGNAMDNIVSGGTGNDTVNGLDGNDSLAGGAGADSVSGGNGDDRLYGGSISPGIYGFSSLLSDSAVDTLNGGAGNDRYHIDALDDAVVESSTGGFDVVMSAIDNNLNRSNYNNVEAMLLLESSEAYMARGSGRNDVMVGNSLDNFITGAAGDDTLAGGAAPGYYNSGSDILDAGDGNDVLLSSMSFGGYYASGMETTMFGGVGNDLYVLGDSSMGYGGLDSGGTDTAILLGNTGSIEALEGVENLLLYGTGAAEDARAREAIQVVWRVAVGTEYTGGYGTAYNATGNALSNRITGNSQSNQLLGLGGKDTIIGSAGDDTLDGGAGDDSLVGGVGNDRYVLEGTDTVVENPGEGFDIVVSPTLTSYAGFANVEGLVYAGTANVTLSNGAGNTSNDYFGGGSGRDTLQGYGGNDTLLGGEGNDQLSGGTENDSLVGEGGNDQLLGEAGVDTLLGGEGNDTLDGDTELDYLYGGAGADSLDGGDGGDYLVAGDQTWSSETDTNTLNGGAGNDTIYGAAGNDTLDGGSDNDQLQGNAGDDSISGGAGADTVYGQAGNDTIAGGGVTGSATYYAVISDVLYGTSGSYGDNGSTDSDTFVFGAPTGSGAVETSAGSGQFYFNAGAFVGDFFAGSDTIRLDRTMVGDGDAFLENVQIKETAGGTFNRGAEMVVVRADVGASFGSSYGLSYFAAQPVIDAIGSANSAFAVGNERIFVVDNGQSSAVFQFVSSDTDALVEANELFLVAVIANNTMLDGSVFTLA